MQHTEQHFQNNSASVIHNLSPKFVVFNYSFIWQQCVPREAKELKRNLTKCRRKLTQPQLWKYPEGVDKHGLPSEEFH